MVGRKGLTCFWRASTQICAANPGTVGTEVDQTMAAMKLDQVTVPQKDQRIETLDSERIAGSLLAQLDTPRLESEEVSHRIGRRLPS